MSWKDDRPRRLKYARDYHERNKEAEKDYREANKIERNRAHSERRTTDRNWLIKLLGGVCSYCGDSKHLQLDHRDGGGGEERRKMHNRPSTKYPVMFRKGEITELEIHTRLTLACKWCNVLKGSVREKEWRDRIKGGMILKYAQRMKEYNDTI